MERPLHSTSLPPAPLARQCYQDTPWPWGACTRPLRIISGPFVSRLSEEICAGTPRAPHSVSITARHPLARSLLLIGRGCARPIRVSVSVHYRTQIVVLISFVTRQWLMTIGGGVEAKALKRFFATAIYENNQRDCSTKSVKQNGRFATSPRPDVATQDLPSPLHT